MCIYRIYRIYSHSYIRCTLQKTAIFTKMFIYKMHLCIKRTSYTKIHILQSDTNGFICMYLRRKMSYLPDSDALNSYVLLITRDLGNPRKRSHNHFLYAKNKIILLLSRRSHQNLRLSMHCWRARPIQVTASSANLPHLRFATCKSANWFPDSLVKPCGISYFHWGKFNKSEEPAKILEKSCISYTPENMVICLWYLLFILHIIFFGVWVFVLVQWVFLLF